MYMHLVFSFYSFFLLVSCFLKKYSFVLYFTCSIQLEKITRKVISMAAISLRLNDKTCHLYQLE